MQVIKDSNGHNVQIAPSFYACRYCNTTFVKLNPFLFRNTNPLKCMFCDQTFIYPPKRDFHMCHEHLGEEKPIVHCSECSETFECQHDKERYWCIYSDLPELEVEPEKKLTTPIPKPEQVVAFIGDSHESPSYLRNLPEDVAYITDICCHKNTCSLRNLARKSDN